MSQTFELESFVAECRSALPAHAPQRNVRESVARAISDPASLLREIGEPARGGIYELHRAEDLTVIHVVWAPRMTLMPHDHRMWAVIGVYGGREDNIFWRRIEDGPTEQIEAAGARSLGAGESTPLGSEIIHSVTNPTSQLTGAIHVYGGDFFDTTRSEWDPITLREMPYDIAKNLRLFEEANATLPASPS